MARGLLIFQIFRRVLNTRITCLNRWTNSPANNVVISGLLLACSALLLTASNLILH